MPLVEIKYEDIFFDPKVQELCVSPSFTCPFYNHTWSCPPAAPYLEKAISTYEEFYLIYSKFDLEAYIKKEREKRPNRSEFFIKNTFLLTKSFEQGGLENEFKSFLAQYDKEYKKKLLLYDGTCRFCKIQKTGKCTFDSGEPCRFPKDKRYSMEAVGIEVVRTVLELKLDIEYPSNKYSYRFGLVCFI